MGFMDFIKSTIGPSGIKTRVDLSQSTFSWNDASIPGTVTFTCSGKEARTISSIHYKMTMEQKNRMLARMIQVPKLSPLLKDNFRPTTSYNLEKKSPRT